jgi:hypothetical protein
MKSITAWIRFITFGLMLAAVPLVGGCSDNTITWTEEVKLLDGRVITVTQKRRIDTKQMPREAWLTFKLPEFGDREIVWHESLHTLVMNLYQGKLYVVGNYPSQLEACLYGNPRPSYIGFRYDNSQWVRIPFNEIPEAIYDANMYFENMALYRLSHVSLVDKERMFKDEGYTPDQRRIDSKYVSAAHCSKSN